MERSPSWERTFLEPRSVRNSRSDFAPAIPATTSWRIKSKESSNLYQHQRLEAFKPRWEMLFTEARQTSFAEVLTRWKWWIVVKFCTSICPTNRQHTTLLAMVSLHNFLQLHISVWRQVTNSSTAAMALHRSLRVPTFAQAASVAHVVYVTGKPHTSPWPGRIQNEFVTHPLKEIQ